MAEKRESFSTCDSTFARCVASVVAALGISVGAARGGAGGSLKTKPNETKRNRLLGFISIAVCFVGGRGGGGGGAGRESTRPPTADRRRVFRRRSSAQNDVAAARVVVDNRVRHSVGGRSPPRLVVRGGIRAQRHRRRSTSENVRSNIPRRVSTATYTLLPYRIVL